jgi:hypothetical protein
MLLPEVPVGQQEQEYDAGGGVLSPILLFTDIRLFSSLKFQAARQRKG